MLGGSSPSPGKPPLPHIRTRQASTDSAASARSHSNNHNSNKEQHVVDREERAELGLLASLEHRRSHTKTSSGDVWYSAVEGERPPLHSVPSHATAAMESTASTHSGSVEGTNTAKSNLRNLARRVMEMNRTVTAMTNNNNNTTAANNSATTSISTVGSSDSGSHTTNNSKQHRRRASRAHVLLGMIQEDENETDTDENNKNNNRNDESAEGLFRTVGGDAHLEQGESLFSIEGTNTDRLFAGASIVNDLFESNEETPSENSNEPQEESTANYFDESVRDDNNNNGDDDETRPLRSLHRNDSSGYGSSANNSAGGNSSYGNNNNMRLARKKKKSNWEKMRARICHFLHPVRLIRLLSRTLESAYFAMASIPIFFVSWVLYQYLDNPSFDFLPGNASLAWWVNLLGRLCLTLELARLVQWIVMDNIVLGTRTAARLLGPLVTLYAIQGRGWPFVVTTWSVINLFLLHGTRKFQNNWLLFVTYGFSNPEGEQYTDVLGTGEYLRIWLAFIVAGVVSSAKRTIVAMHFGRRTFSKSIEESEILAFTRIASLKSRLVLWWNTAEFKPRLEKLLKEVVLISEVAELALEIERSADEMQETLEIELHGADRKVKFLGDISWSSDPRLMHRSRTSSLQIDSDDESETTDVTGDKGKRKDDIGEFRASMNRRSSSANIPFKDLLDYWEEPINKMDRSMNASIQDILKFRRALVSETHLSIRWIIVVMSNTLAQTFMDEPYPLGEAFGPATTRDEVLKSAADVYRRMASSPDSSVLSCDVLYLLTEDEDGVTVDKSKRRAIRKLFQPNADNEVSILHFVKACDSLYRRMRYFRASVGNASVIDHALESIVDGFYNFLLCLVTLSILQINPWPLLVSISTLLVSISFAVGPSAAKYIEGILLIAIRRPFDLGDRIYMHEPSVVDSTGLGCSWFVEVEIAFSKVSTVPGATDINLFNTTIRYAGTNEVATLSNGPIAHMRIVNGNRSPNAMVWFQLPFNMTVMEGGKMASLKVSLENYARMHPHKWHSCSYVRADEFHPDIEKVVVTIGFQSRSSWQDLGGIYFSKSDLIAATIEYSRQQGIIYEELPQRQLHYKAGSLQKGGVWNHRAQLHSPSNIMSIGDGATGKPESIYTTASIDAHEQNTPLAGSGMNRDERMMMPPDEEGNTEVSPNSLFLSRLHGSH
eukprot:scaffold945_cov170-Amphora_coffeaeformis.AAC.20